MRSGNMWEHQSLCKEALRGLHAALKLKTKTFWKLQDPGDTKMGCTPRKVADMERKTTHKIICWGQQS